MKQVFTTKDGYQNNSLRVIYFEKDAAREVKRYKWNEETEQVETVILQEAYDHPLFCERLFWETSEAELDVIIENTRQGWEERINS